MENKADNASILVSCTPVNQYLDNSYNLIIVSLEKFINYQVVFRAEKQKNKKMSK